MSVDPRVNASIDTFTFLAQALITKVTSAPNTSLLRHQEEMRALIFPLLDSAINLADALADEVADLKERVTNLEGGS